MNKYLKIKVFAISWIFLILGGFSLSAYADTQDYVRGHVLYLKNGFAYFDIGEDDGVAVGNPFEIYYDQRNICNGTIIWADKYISKSATLDSLPCRAAVGGLVERGCTGGGVDCRAAGRRGKVDHVRAEKQYSAGSAGYGFRRPGERAGRYRSGRRELADQYRQD